MRRALAVAAAAGLLVSGLMSLPAAASARSAELVATGTVVGATGHAMPGAVVDLYAWPPQQVLITLKPGQKVPERLLATTTADAAGAYALTVAAASLKPDENAAGYTDLEVDS